MDYWKRQPRFAPALLAIIAWLQLSHYTLARAAPAAPPAAAPASAKPPQSLTAADLGDLFKLAADNAPNQRWADVFLEDLGKLQATAGEFAAAEATAKKIKGDGSERVIGRIVAVRAAKEGKDVAAEVRRLKLNILNEVTLVEIARTEASAGRFAGARAVAGMLEPGVYASHAWLAIAKTSRQKTDLHLAMKSFRKPPHDSELIEVAEAQAACGDLEQAMQTVDRLKQTGFDRPEALWRITRAQALAGDIEGAKATAAKINVDEINDVEQAWACIAMVLAAKGDVEGTKAAIEKLPGTLEKPIVTALSAYAQAKSGDLTAARATARSLGNAQFNKYRSLGLAYGLIAAAEVDRGQMDTAQAALKLAISALTSGRSNSDKAEGALLVLKGAIYGPRAVESEGVANYE
jgi:cell wall assembly regulator SMI1